MELNESTKLAQVRNELLEHAKNHALHKNVLDTKGHIVFGRGDDESKILFIEKHQGSLKMKMENLLWEEAENFLKLGLGN